MADINELGGTQTAPDGTTVENPGNETAPELNNDDELNNDNGEGGEGEGGEEQQEAQGKTGTEEQPDKNKPKPFYEKRFGELTRKAREAERERDELKARLDALERGEAREKPAEPEAKPAPRQQPETDVEKAAERLVEQREFNARVAKVISAGESEYDKDDFTKKCNLIADIGGQAVPDFMKIVTDSDMVADGHKVIAALAEDPEEAERVLSLNPVKMALALTKLSEKLAKPVAKQHSKVPAPVDPVNGAARTSSRLDDPNIPMEDFADQFLKNMASRRR
jgi:hypothetical protein